MNPIKHQHFEASHIAFMKFIQSKDQPNNFHLADARTDCPCKVRARGEVWYCPHKVQALLVSVHDPSSAEGVDHLTKDVTVPKGPKNPSLLCERPGLCICTLPPI